MQGMYILHTCGLQGPQQIVFKIDNQMWGCAPVCLLLWW